MSPEAVPPWRKSSVWLAGSDTSEVYLGRTAAAVWTLGSSDAGPQWLSAESAQQGWGQAVEVLAQAEPRKRRRRVAVWLSGALARPFMFRPVQGLRRWSEALQVAAGLAPDATGLNGPCEVWLDDWIPDRPCIAVAVERELRDAIEAAARNSRVRLTALGPWWVAALNDSVQKHPESANLVAINEPDALTVVSGRGGRFDSAASFAPRPEPNQIEALLTRTLLSADLTSAQGMRAMMTSAAEASSQPFGVSLEPLA